MIRRIKVSEKFYFGTRREDGKRAVENNSRRPTRKKEKKFYFRNFLKVKSNIYFEDNL
jgi:hypothetical protein